MPLLMICLMGCTGDSSPPVRPIELMFRKIIPYAFVGLVQVTIILSLGHTFLMSLLTAVYLFCWVSRYYLF
jgi:ABC-type Na+ efflux pump permease subunit